MDLVVQSVLVRAREWAKARAALARVIDSKSASAKQVEAAKKAFANSSATLFKAIMRFEAMLKRRPNGRTKSIDWHALFGAVGVFAEALESSVQPEPPPRHVHVQVIDTQGEDV